MHTNYFASFTNNLNYKSNVQNNFIHYIFKFHCSPIFSRTVLKEEKKERLIKIIKTGLQS